MQMSYLEMISIKHFASMISTILTEPVVSESQSMNVPEIASLNASARTTSMRKATRTLRATQTVGQLNHEHVLTEVLKRRLHKAVLVLAGPFSTSVSTKHQTRFSTTSPTNPFGGKPRKAATNEGTLGRCKSQ